MPDSTRGRLERACAPFNDPDFLYEVKFDGFRALAYVEDWKRGFVPGRPDVHETGEHEGPIAANLHGKKP